MCDVYHYLKSEKGKKIILLGWKAAGIASVVDDGHAGNLPTLDPYVSGFENWQVRRSETG